MLSCLFR